MNKPLTKQNKTKQNEKRLEGSGDCWVKLSLTATD